MINLTGAADKGTVGLNWTAVSEVTIQSFIIERSTNLNNWSALANIPGAGNSINNAYQYTDANPVSGTNYYRIKQLDVNGNFSYSNVLAINFERNTLSVTPNPFNEFINISFVDALTIEGSLDSDLDVSIHDVLGKLWFHSNVNHINGTIHIEPNLPNGTYIITVQSISFVEQMKVIKK
jgi:hypothetical protein